MDCVCGRRDPAGGATPGSDRWNAGRQGSSYGEGILSRHSTWQAAEAALAAPERADDVLDWDLVQPIIAGTSGLDVPRLHVSDRASAEAFLACYGFDWSLVSHREQLEDLRREALTFIEEELLHDEPHLRVHPEVRGETDVRTLLLWSARPPGDELQRWACTVLRVMHTFAHCGSYFKRRFDEQIQRQILQRFEPHLHRRGETLHLGDGPSAIALEAFEVKGSKSRTSMAMKLLHKADNTAAEVFDWIGVRFITRERYDALLVVQYLRRHSVVMFAHVKPGRSRNTLIDLDRLRSDVARLSEGKTLDGLRGTDLDTLRQLVRSYPYPRPPAAGRNVFTSIAYHSIQFTCSQQVIVPADLPVRARARVDALRAEMPECTAAVDALVSELTGEEEARFLFPFEVQVLDGASWELTRAGLASHDVYKARQRHAVKRRLWGNLIAPEPSPVRR